MVIKKEEVMYLDNVLTSIEQELNKYRSIINNINEMARAMNKIDLIDRKKCRERVEQKFSLQKMVDNYELIIKNLTK